MNKKFCLILFCFYLFAFSAFSQIKTLKIATVAPSRSVWDIEEKRLAQEWAKATNGQVQMQFMSSNAMGGESAVIQKLNSVRPGQRAPIDGALFTNIGVANLAPETYFLTLALPFLFDSQDEIDYILEKFDDRFQSAMIQKGYVVLGWFNVGWAYFFTKKPVHTPKDLKSQRLSVAGVGTPELSGAFKAAGFNTIDVSAEKLLSSVRSPGGAEGFYTIPLYAFAGQYYKALPYILDIPVFPVTAAFVISEKSWAEIPEQYKAEMIEIVKNTEKRFVEEQKNSDKEYISRCVQGGCTLVTPTEEERTVMVNELRSNIKAMIDSGLANEELLNAVIKALAEYRNK